MFEIPSVRIGRLFGIPIEVNFSWFIIFALVAFSLASSVFPEIEASQGSPAWLYAFVGMTTALLFFGSILLHELSHSLVARAEGGKVDKITLFIFGGVAQMDEEPRTPGREFLMAAAGPGMSFAISVLCFVSYLAASAKGTPWWLWAPLEYLAGVNLLVAIFNLLPGFPLDGGRVLRSILWAFTRDLLKATLWASRIGQVIGWAFVVWAIGGVAQGRSDLIWLGLIGWFIASLAGEAYRQQVMRSRTQGVPVWRIMTPDPVFVSGEVPIDVLVHDHFLTKGHSRYPVLFDGAIVGLVSLADVRRIPRPDWPFVRTIDVTNRDLPELVVDAQKPVADVIGRLTPESPGALIVSRDGRLAGIVTRADVISLLQGDEGAVPGFRA